MTTELPARLPGNQERVYVAVEVRKVLSNENPAWIAPRPGEVACYLQALAATGDTDDGWEVWGVVGVPWWESEEDLPGRPHVLCPGCCRFRAIGVSAESRNAKLRDHWPSCPGVGRMWFNPDGSLSQVVFRGQ